MTDIFTLLSFPSTSSAFTVPLKSGLKDSAAGSASPPHKAVRLECDSDAPSASRYDAKDPKTSLKIKFVGNQMKRPLDWTGPLALLKRSVTAVLTRNPEQFLDSSYESIYTACQLLVTIHNKGEGLYDFVKIELEKSIHRLASHLKTFTPEVEKAESPVIKWIEEFVSASRWFEDAVSLLRSLLTYLDQRYVVSRGSLSDSRTLAYDLFTQRILEDFAIASRLRTGISEWLTWERKLRIEHDIRGKVLLLVSSLISHGQYSSFEEYYIRNTSEFYITESNEMAQSMKGDPDGFFKHACVRIEEENERAQELLPVGSWSLVRDTTERSLWSERLHWIAMETVGPYINSKNFSTLDTLYKLFSRVGGVKILVASFKYFVQKSVHDIVNDEANDDTMVQCLLDFKSLVDTSINTAFEDNSGGGIARNTQRKDANNLKSGSTSSAISTKKPNLEFTYALMDAFTLGFKARRNKPAEMIAKYLDKAMRRGQGSMNDEEFEGLLDAVQALCRFTEDKDVFRTFYHRFLAKRLLLQKSASDDFEKGMLKKLKINYDHEFGTGEDMFKDLVLSREMMREYHSKLDNQNSGQKLNVAVLQRSAWPFTVRKSTLDMPLDMQEDLASYAKYYNSRHSGHILDWDHALGTATMRAQFARGEKELSLSLYQSVVLLLFNDSSQWDFKDIVERTRLDDADLRLTLQSLACGKKKILKKIPPGRDVNNSDAFKFNADFEDPRAKVHINSIQARVTTEESRRTNVTIEDDRKHTLDAAIVRVMKANKEMTYEQLKASTIDAVKSHFVPQVEAIKKRIDALVEGEYLERSKDDKNLFLYVA